MRTTTASALLSFALIALAVDARADEPKKDAPATASKADEASQRFKNGVAFYKDKDFTAAMVEFKKAYELLPNYNVLFNIGQTARELKDYAAALVAFEQYLRDGGAKVSAARKKDVQASIEELKHKVGKIKVTTNVEGAEILVDDVSVGTAPLSEPVVPTVGRRKLAATASGYAPAQRVVDVASMAETAVSLELTKVEGIGSVEPAKDTPPPKQGVPIVVWATLGATGAAALTTAVLGGLAVSARGGLKDALNTFPGDPKAISAAQSKTRTFAVATDVMGGITIAGAVTTALLFVLAPRTAEKAKAMVEISPTGIGVRGVF